MQVEYIARICFTSWRTAEQQGHCTISSGMLRQVIIDAEHMAAFIHEILSHRNTGVRCQILQRRTISSRSSNDDGVFHSAMLCQRVYHTGYSRRLLADGYIYAYAVLALLIDNRINGNSRLTSTTVADDELALAASNRYQSIDGFDTSLQRLMYRLTICNTRCPVLNRTEFRCFDSTLAINRTAESIDDTADQCVANRHLHDLARTFYLVAFHDLSLATENNSADIVLLKVQNHSEYIIAEIEQLASHSLLQAVDVGDTVTDALRPAPQALPGYRRVKPVVFCGFYPIERDEYPELRDALEKLTLNDASITFVPETSVALGFGFRCGFLGLLHMDVSKERLRREFDIDLVATSPNVVYEVVTTGGDVIEAKRPSDFPDGSEISEIREPMIRLTCFVPTEFVGKVMQFCQDKRGTFVSMDYLSPERARLFYDLPLAEFIIDFHDKMKSMTRGYASLDYEYRGFRAADLVRVDVLISGEAADAFSFICHRDAAFHRGQAVVRKLKELIPQQLFEVPIQASIGKRVIVRQNIKALRKDVLAKCYGGDISRKRKLLEKQKEGKKRMKQIGKVSIPQEAFLAFLKVEEGEDE